MARPLLRKPNSVQIATEYGVIYMMVENPVVTYYFYGPDGATEDDFDRPIWAIERVVYIGEDSFRSWGEDAEGNFRTMTLIPDDREDYFPAVPFLNTHSILFDGVNDRIDVTNVNILSSLSTTYTVAIWAKLGALNFTFQNLTGAGRSTDSTPVLYTLRVNASNQLEWLVRDNLNVAATVPFTVSAAQLNQWYRVVGVRSGTNFTIYVNGVAGTPVSATLGTITNDVICIGARRNSAVSNFFVGNLMQEDIYNVAFTAAEVTEDFNGGILMNPLMHSRAANLISSKRLGTNDAYPTIEDMVGSNDGLMINMAANQIQAGVTP